MIVSVGTSALRRAWWTDDAQLARALGAGGEDVVLVQDVEHARPHQPRDDARHRPAEHEGGQDQVPQRVEEQPKSPASSASMVMKPVTKGGERRARVERGPDPAASPALRRR